MIVHGDVFALDAAGRSLLEECADHAQQPPGVAWNQMLVD